MEKIDFVVVGNLSYDYNFFPNRKEKKVMNLGGATLYSGIPASLFVKVGIAAKVGMDYDIRVFDNLNFDIEGLKQVEGKTTVFTQEFQSEDGQQRIFKEFVNPNTILTPSDIPKKYLNAKYIHVCTNYPKVQLELVKYLKKNSKAILSIDTLEDYYYDEKEIETIKESFDLVDIAYIDKEFKKLYDCKAPIKIFKLGKEGCKFVSKEKTFQAKAPICNYVVDKTGAGDCVTGVFGALKSLEYTDEDALQTAVNTATESIKEHGMFHLIKKIYRRNIMKNYANENVEFIGCPGCAYANHDFTIPCGIAYENDNFTLSQDWELPIIGFFVVAPKRHIEKLEELTSSEKTEMFEIVDKTIRILRQNKICDRFNVIFEEKEGIHFHIWIMPRHKWMEELVAGITKNIGDVFNYAKNNMRTTEIYDEINRISKIVREEFNK